MSNARILSKLFPLSPLVAVVSKLLNVAALDPNVTTLNNIAIQGALPSGSIIDFAGATPPTGWFLCDGSKVSSASYPELFAAIGTTYNTGGEAAGEFRLPDLRGRVVAGRDNMGGTTAGRLTGTSGGVLGTGLGNAGGSQTHTLDASQIPAHTHSVTVGSAIANGSGYSVIGSGGTNVKLGADAVTSSSVGSGGAHNNVQPTIVLNKIIKT